MERRMKKLFSEIPYIEGKRLVLKKITRDDAPGLQKLVVSGSDEDWGYDKPLPTDKWIR
jgi:hypothetical protein